MPRTTTARSYPSEGTPGSTVVRAATVVTRVGPVIDAEVVIEDTMVVEVRAARGTAPPVVLVPGFVDLQVNGIGAIDVAGATGADWDALDRALLAQGVTTWCPTLVTASFDALEDSLAAIAEAARRRSAGRPHIAGAHLEGPFLAVPGAHRPELVRSEVDRGWLDSLGDLVRIVTLAPELPGALEAIEDLSSRGVLVSLGHSAAPAEIALEAADAGARLVTHLGNAMGPLHQRAPGLLGVALADDRMSVSVIADLVHTHAVFVRMAFTAKSAQRVALITDAVATSTASGPPRLPDGTLAGSVLTMDSALSNVVSRSGVSLDDAVEAASSTPARLLGLDDRGSIAPGRRGDLVALAPRTDGSWRVVTVWVAGSVAWESPDQPGPR